MSFSQTVKHAFMLSLWWVPRIFSILFALFLAVFSFDIFGQGFGTGKTIMTFIIHNIPTAIVIIITILSWKRSRLGAGGFILLGVIFFFFLHDKSKSLLTVLPLIVTGLLFYLSWLLRADIKKARKE